MQPQKARTPWFCNDLQKGKDICTSLLPASSFTQYALDAVKLLHVLATPPLPEQMDAAERPY